MAEVVPTLDSRGYLTGIPEKAAELLTNFLASDYSQSELFPNRVKSFQYYIQRNMGNFRAMAVEIEDAVNQLYIGHFDDVSASVTIDPPQSDLNMSPVRYNVQLNITVIENNVQYSVGKIITMTNSKIENIRPLERR